MDISMWICSNCDAVNWITGLKSSKERTTMTCPKCGATKELFIIHYDYPKQLEV
jgi:rubrerythrin